MLVFYTEDVSLKGVFLQRAIAGRAVVLRGLLQSGTWSYYFKWALFFLEGVS